MNLKLFISALLFTSIVCSCNRNAKKVETQNDILLNREAQSSYPDDQKDQKQKLQTGDLKQSQADTAFSPTPVQSDKVDWDKKITKTATVKLEVKDFKKYSESIQKIVRDFGGYVSQERQNLTDDRSETSLSIKVPVEQFETMMNELSSGDVKVMERLITSQDVTSEIIDVKSRLEARKQVRQKYLAFLKDSKNMEDVLKVQGEINGIQEEIEAAGGRINYLSHQSAFSTINLTFYQPAPGFKPVDLSPSFLTRVSNAFKAGADWIAELLIAMISIWPLLLIGAGVIFIFKRVKSFKSNPQNP